MRFDLGPVPRRLRWSLAAPLALIANALAAFSFLSLAHAADLYVSTQGSDANPGTAIQPFRTITYAYGKAVGVTTIYVLPGVYTDYISGWGLRLNKSGTAASPIVLRSTVRGGAVIDGQNGADRNKAVYITGNYNVLDGFEIRNGPLGGIAVYGSNNRILNNEIHHNGNPASTSTNGRDGIYSDRNTSGNWYVANSIHDNGRTGSNLDHGLYLCGKSEAVLNNLLFRNAATGLQVAGYATVSNMKVYNNVMAWNGTSGIVLWLSLSGIDIKNNIVYRNGGYGLNSHDAHGGGVVLDRNLIYGNGSGGWTFTAQGSDYAYSLRTTLTTDPLFVQGASAGFDARLNARSPALKAGLNLSSVFITDIIGAARPASGPWDLGPYAYASSANTTPRISGTYNGLFFEPEGVWQPTAGGITITITPRGKYSGKLQLGPRAYSFSGQLTGTGAGLNTVERRNDYPLTIQFQMDADDADLLTGTITDGHSWTANMSVDRAIFDGKTSVSPDQGQYTLLIPGDFTQTGAPGGDSYGTVAVDKTGRLRFAGSLADGTKVSQSSRVSKNGRWPLFKSLYRGEGGLSGWMLLNPSPDKELEGDVTWIKPQISGSQYYPDGFAVSLKAWGSRYLRPGREGKVLNLDLAMIEFNGAYPAQNITNTIALDSRNRVVNQSSNPLSLSISTSNGLFAGKVWSPVSRGWLRFRGVVLQSDVIGGGFFLGRSQSGKVWFQAPAILANTALAAGSPGR